MKVMEYSPVVVSQKYVHPTPGVTERAFERLNAANEKALASLPGVTQGQPTACLRTTISTTSVDAESEDVKQVL